MSGTNSNAPLLIKQIHFGGVAAMDRRYAAGSRDRMMWVSS
jgi:hypothetical protein